ncbi:MAG TPA: helix-turn-helix transcriptional regulator [Terriglobales bacterium]|nr:helix-turn-helix transcriptional regulator [Terriglobales bacterium]
MDVTLVIRRRLRKLGLEQRDLAIAAHVTESYISQLLTGKKAPPAPERTKLYERIGAFLRLPKGELSRMAELQRTEEIKKKLGPTDPLFREVRELILRKCVPAKRNQARAIFEKQPFGELERLVTQKLLEVAKNVAREKLASEPWLRLVARLSHRSRQQMRASTLEFLDADISNLSVENCTSFLDPLIESWDIDLLTFRMEVVLNRRLVPANFKKLEFVEQEVQPLEEPGLKEFLRNRALSADASEEEIEFLKKLRIQGKRPTALYYYRELQNLRDPLHFQSPARLSRMRKRNNG